MFTNVYTDLPLIKRNQISHERTRNRYEDGKLHIGFWLSSPSKSFCYGFNTYIPTEKFDRHSSRSVLRLVIMKFWWCPLKSCWKLEKLTSIFSISIIQHSNRRSQMKLISCKSWRYRCRLNYLLLVILALLNPKKFRNHIRFLSYPSNGRIGGSKEEKYLVFLLNINMVVRFFEIFISTLF